MTAVQDGLDGDAAARQLNDAHRQLLGDNSIQFELPAAGSYSPAQQGSVQQGSVQQGEFSQGPVSQPPPTAPPADPTVAPAQPVPAQQIDPSFTPPAQPPDQPGSSGGGLDGLMQVFLWIAAGVALAILLYWLFAWFRDRRLGGREGKARKLRDAAADREAWRLDEDQATELLDEADVLANEGRYDEAARLLLHRSIGEIDAYRPDLVRPALTSRDIAGHPLLPAAPAAAFARIAALVERSLFARRPLGPDDWQHCRAAYREFAFADGWQG